MVTNPGLTHDVFNRSKYIQPKIKVGYVRQAQERAQRWNNYDGIEWTLDLAPSLK